MAEQDEALTVEAIELLEVLGELKARGLIELDEAGDDGEPRIRPTALGVKVLRAEEQRRAPGIEATDADVVCEHGTAMDVHCCNCHSGFLFTPSQCVCLSGADRGAA